MKAKKASFLVAAAVAAVAAVQVSATAQTKHATKPATLAAAQPIQLAPVTVPAALKAALAGKRVFDQSALQAKLSYTPDKTPLLKFPSGRQVVLEKIRAEPPPPASRIPAAVTAKLQRYRPYVNKFRFGRGRVVPGALVIQAADHEAPMAAIEAHLQGRDTLTASPACSWPCWGLRNGRPRR